MKLERLKNRADFINAAKKGRRWITPAFVVQICDSPQQDNSVCRVGFTATKKMDKRAVGRNRAKRRLRAMSQSVLQNYALYGKDIVFIARQAVLSDDFENLLKNCHWALKRLEIKQHGETKKN